jgi:hypothetical protein
MRADLNLKRRQAFWETPKSLAGLAVATVAIFGLLAGWAGWNIGRDLARPSPPIQVTVQFPPGTTIHAPEH